MNRCLDEQTLARLADDPSDVSMDARGHLRGCARCRALLTTLGDDEVARDQPPRRGTRVGRYEINAMLGAGAMGRVYRAYDVELERWVALKILASPRTLFEATALARARAPSVVTVYDVGVDRGVAFIAMELVDGRTLSAWLSERSRSRAERVTISLALADGVVAMHEAGVVHGDLKPSNVLVDTAQAPRLIDFGLAHVGHRGTAGATRAYAAPELARGSRPNAATDQYSLAMLIGEVLGKPTAAVATVLGRARASTPERRFTTARAFSEALRAATRHEVSRRRRWLRVASVAMYGWVLGAAISGGSTSRAPRPEFIARFGAGPAWQTLERTYAPASVMGPCAVTQARLRDATVAHLLSPAGSLAVAHTLIAQLLPPRACHATDDDETTMSARVAAATVLLRAGDLEGAEAIARDDGGPEAAIVRAGVRELRGDIAGAKKALEPFRSSASLRARDARLAHLARTGSEEALDEATALRVMLEGRDTHGIYALATLQHVAKVLALSGSYGVADALGAEVLAQARALLGEQHPAVAEAWFQLATTAELEGEPGRYSEAVRRGVEIAGAYYPREHPYMTRALIFLAEERTQRARYEEALALLDEAARHADAARTRADINERRVRPLIELGREAEAREIHFRATADADGDDRLWLDVGWAELLLATGRAEEAMHQLLTRQRALPGHPSGGDTLLALLLAKQQPTRAEAWLARIGARHDALGHARELAARALISGDQSQHARALDAYRGVTNAYAGERAWLRQP